MGSNDRHISSSTLAEIRGILVKSLSRENLSITDKSQLLSSSRKNLHVSFEFAGNRDATTQQKQSRPASASGHKGNDFYNKHFVSPTTIHWFACVGADVTDPPIQLDNKSLDDEDEDQNKDREERLKFIKEKQNEERQKKLEELKAQALAAQKFREQKEDERRRRVDELRCRDNDRRNQVEERKRAIWEAERERREYILRKNQEREQRLETKKRNEKSQIMFAFGSSTPRMTEAEGGMSSSFWSHRRATSISNVAYTPLTRRSSERELSDGSKKRATSASGLDRQTEDQRRISNSMYEVFNWGANTEYTPKKQLSLSIAGSHINIDEPQQTISSSNSRRNKDDSTESSSSVNCHRTVNRRKTDLMPTIPSPRDSSRSSFGTHTPRTPGRAFSMTRLDQLAQPRRRNGEHMSAIIERERRLALDIENESRLSLSRSSTSPTTNNKRMSRSMTQLAGGKNAGHHPQHLLHQQTQQIGGGGGVRKFNGLFVMKKNDTSKSMSQLVGASTDIDTKHSYLNRPKSTRSEKLRQQIREHLKQTTTVVNHSPGLRSGEITPTSLNTTSRPGSSMSSSTTGSAVVLRRTLPTQSRRPRPASIAVTGVNLAKEGEIDNKKTDKPPLPKPASSTGASQHKRPLSVMSTPTKSLDIITPKKNDKRPSSVRVTPKATPLQSPGPDSANKTIMQHQNTTKQNKKDKDNQEKNEKTTVTNINGNSVNNEISKDGKIEIIDKLVKEEVKEVKEIVKDAAAIETDLIKMDEPFANEINLLNVDHVAEKQDQMKIEKNEIVESVDTNLNAKEIMDTPVANVGVAEQSKVTGSIDTDNNNIENVAKLEVSTSVTTTSTTAASTENEVETVQNIIDFNDNVDMSASMIAKARITTEEEAKAALAARRRQAREEAERQADLERKRIEAEEEAEHQRQLEEEERQRKLEEDTIRLAEEQKLMEEERLKQAIEETAKREEEERLKREEAAKQKAEREESERKAREETEKQRIETVERLKKEEKEREERKKRVEAIMARTRTKGNPNNTPTKNSDTEDKNSDSSVNNKNEMTESMISMTESMTQSIDNTNANFEELSNTDANILNNTTIIQNNENQNEMLQQSNFEKSVTEKENLLLGSFNNINLNSSENNLNNHHTNGKTTTATTELIIEDALLNQSNGHKNASIDNVFKTLPLNDTKILTHQDLTTGQLIDFSNLSDNQTNDELNFNNNNNNNNNNLLNNTTRLVTSDSQDNRDLSLL